MTPPGESIGAGLPVIDLGTRHASRIFRGVPGAATRIPAMPSPGDRGFRFILATRRLDRAYQRLDQLRSTAILAVASDAALDRFNAWAYERSASYRPGSEEFRTDLFPWEEVAIERFFPRAPARVLVGGAGGGREPLALARSGYEVVAFEPAEELARAMADAAAADGLGVDAYVGGYDDVERLERVQDGAVRSATSLGPFDAAIAGWGSFTHIRTRAARVATLEALGRVTSGPLLVSFIALRPDGDGGGGSELKRRLLARRSRVPHDQFSMYMGFQHPVNAGEVAELAAEAGLEIVHLDFGGTTLAPYAVLGRPDAGRTRKG
jgi:hypothetical protein